MTASSDNKKEDDKSTPNKTSSNDEKTKDADSSSPSDDGHKYGYDLYPERRGGEHKTNWLRAFFMLEGREQQDKIRCEKNVYNCIRTSPLVQLMMAALKSSGCEIDIRRHLSCEFCSGRVSGGYDPQLNQALAHSHVLQKISIVMFCRIEIKSFYLYLDESITILVGFGMLKKLLDKYHNIVVCQNNTKTYGIVQGVLTHEMIHMFDFCRNKLDFKNIDHLACTEIRAANLTHCSFLSAMTQGKASFFNIKERHQDCVKNKAVASVMAVRDVTYEQAVEAVERVFPKCYPDLEPIGRRLRAGSKDMYKAYYEATLYGYDV